MRESSYWGISHLARLITCNQCLNRTLQLEYELRIKEEEARVNLEFARRAGEIKMSA